MALKEVFNSTRVILAVAAATGFLFSPAAMADVEWIGAAGDGGKLLTGKNWTGDVAPSTGDTAAIGDVPAAVLSNGSATYAHLKLGTVSGKTGALTVGNGGNLTLTVALDGALQMGNADGSAGILTIDGGDVTVQTLDTPNFAATSTVNLVSGTLTINDWADWGRNAKGLATFNQSGGTLDLKKNLEIGRANNGTGIYNMSGGVLKGTAAKGGDFVVGGRAENCVGTFNLTDGTVTFGSAADFRLATHEKSKGYFNQSGGTVTAAGNIQIGRYGTGVYTQTGGSLTCNTYFSIGRYSTGKGTYTITGGTFSAPSQGIFVGEEGSGTLNIGGTATMELPYNMYIAHTHGANGTVVQDGGIVTLKDVRVGHGIGATGVYTLNAGTNRTTTGWAQIGPAGMGKFVQNGGELQMNNGKKMQIADTATGDGVYVINGGLCSVDDEIVVGRLGKGLFVMNGGTVAAKKINSGTAATGQGRVLLNGGTLKATAAGTLFAKGSTTTNDWTIGRDFTIDTNGKDVTSEIASIKATSGSSLTKDGDGTLTMAALPCADVITVAKGTLALSADADNTPSIALAHRWNFNGNLNDSVGGAPASIFGSGVVYTNDSKSVYLPGGTNGTAYVSLGRGILSGDDVTLEFWAERVSMTKWARVFECGTDQRNFVTVSWVRSSNASQNKLAVKYGAVEQNQTDKMAFTDGERIHFAVRFRKNANGTTTITWVKRNPATGEVVKTSDFTPTGLDAGWCLDKVAEGNFNLGHTDVWTSDNDANAIYDEVRVWHGALSDDALTLSAQKGPDATADDIAAIVAKNDETASVERTLEVASGATLDLGGNTLRQPVVKGDGVIKTGEEGALIVTGKMVVNVGECIEASGTIDLSDAEIELADPENLPSEFTFMKPMAGQQLTVVGAPTPANSPKRWKVAVSPDGTCRILKYGFMVIVK